MEKNWQNRQVLALNQNYEPLIVTNAKKAIILVFGEKAEIVEKTERLICSISVKIPLPSVIRLLRYIHAPKKHIMLSRRNIIKRDLHTCQYCGDTKGPFTVDHVIPKHRGGPDTWENLVCACVSCNMRKGNRLPEDANMRLLKLPQRPNHLFQIQHIIGIPDVRWKPYLFLD
ncbi:HNH endonuclease [candidate division KSB1 bacterium]|nr:HNH endonuclease [candidate division KSB1 bacterium]